jgi:G3E family GTPase
MTDKPMPITILTGFLGSGKTTVLNRLLRDPRLNDTAVIVNEFGEIGLDHLLVEKAIDQMVLLDNGCLCCSVRGDLADTLIDLVTRAERGDIPGFSQVMVETTGLADPGPIVETVTADEELAKRFRVKAIVATVDAVSGVSTLDRHDEARAQVAMADLVLVTKIDLPDARPADAEAAVAALNPHAPRLRTAGGAVDPAVVLGVEAMTPPPLHCPVCGSDHDHGHDVDHGHGHGAAAHHHHAHGNGWNIASASILIDRPLPWEMVAGWLEWVSALRGADLLRVKGILAIEGQPGPVLVQAVQTTFSPPVVLPDWPAGDTRSRIVLIARDIPAEALRASFDAFACQERAA